MSRRAMALICLLGCSPGRDAVVPRVDAARPAPVVDAAPRSEPDAARMTLHQAAARCAVDRIGELLSGGAETDPRDGEGRTPLHVATGRCTVDVVRRFVMAGANVRTIGNDGMTPLHEAAAPTLNGVGAYAIWTAGDVEVVRLLIEKGADPRSSTEARRSTRATDRAGRRSTSRRATTPSTSRASSAPAARRWTRAPRPR
jgi:ankyrin repeat protein